jgi:hypothetical protein
MQVIIPKGTAIVFLFLPLIEPKNPQSKNIGSIKPHTIVEDAMSMRARWRVVRVDKDASEAANRFEART